MEIEAIGLSIALVEVMARIFAVVVSRSFWKHYIINASVILCLQC